MNKEILKHYDMDSMAESFGKINRQFHKEEWQAFIKQIRGEVLEELEKGIDHLRQFLNEDCITDPKKMVTNNGIKYWLGLDNFNQRKDKIT